MGTSDGTEPMGLERGFWSPVIDTWELGLLGEEPSKWRNTHSSWRRRPGACEPWEDFNLNKAEGHKWIENKRVYFTIAYVVLSHCSNCCVENTVGTSEPERLISRRLLASLLAQQVKNLLVIQESQQMRARSLGREDPLEKGMAIHSSILSWRIPWTGDPGGLQSMRSQSQTRMSD